MMIVLLLATILAQGNGNSNAASGNSSSSANSNANSNSNSNANSSSSDNSGSSSNSTTKSNSAATPITGTRQYQGHNVLWPDNPASAGIYTVSFSVAAGAAILLQ